ncbi:unnamed protein product [Anisakis simplex]|uniref:Uncharacterized protein n=1 Tax=Anisakis simplex TaxID=6269 RepID=A0A0M3JWD6_ANISI|nr:unnamed protein product [Anisakis simplex]
MRHRLSQFDDGSEVRSRPKRTVHGTIPLNTVTPSEVKLDDQRCDSPISCCVSHRSSISMDSGCISVSSDPRKLSVEERCKQLEESPTNDGHHRIVATAIESTTALRCPETKRYPRNCQRPKSMCCAAFPDESNTLLVDSRSFSQITPPPIHRNFTAVTRCESLQVRINLPIIGCTYKIVKDLPMSPVRVAVGQSPMLQTKPTLYISQEPSSPPHTRIRNPQKPSQMESCLLPKAEPQQSVFHASRVFVERSPRDTRQRVESMEKVDSDEDSTHVAQPAIVVSRY